MKLFHYLLTLLCILACTGCQDDEWSSFDTSNSIDPDADTRAAGNAANALRQLENGYWVADRRVPLVGTGRMVDNLANKLVGVGASQSGINNLIDMDLTNAVGMAGIVGADVVYNQVISVCDMNHIYAGGQTAGFVYQSDNSSLLTLEVLQGFVITSFLNGELQESVSGGTDGKTLDLNLLTVATSDGNQALSLSATLSKPFDEVRLDMRGVDVSVIKSLRVYYAFVGDNPIEHATVDNLDYFPNTVEIHKDNFADTGWTIMAGADKLVDSDLTNGALAGAVIDVGSCVTVNFKQTIPAGREIGFMLTTGSVLDLSVLQHTVLETYDADDQLVEKQTIGSLLGLSLIGGGQRMVSIITKKPCSQIRLSRAGISVDLGATVINYAYVREPDETDLSSYFTVTDVTVHSNGYTLPQAPDLDGDGVPDGKVSYSLLSGPSGSAAVVNDHRLSRMTVDGPYRMEAVYVHTATGRRHVQRFTVTRRTQEAAEADECNQYIDRLSNPNVKAYFPEKDNNGAISANFINIVDLIEGVDGDKNKLPGVLETVIDGNPATNLVYKNGLTLAGNCSIIGVDNGENIPVAAGGSRVGFTLKASTSILDANVLKFLRIIVYDKEGNLVAHGVGDGNNSIGIGLVNVSSNKVRLSIRVDNPFSKVELWTSGLLNLNISKLTVCNAFHEPATTVCETNNGADVCMEMVTAGNSNATIDYDYKTTFSGVTVGSSLTSMGNLLDADVESYAQINMSLEAISAFTVTVKFDPMLAGQQIGFILKDPGYVASVDVIDVQTMEATYCDGAVAKSDDTTVGVASINVIGYTGLIYVSFTPPLRKAKSGGGTRADGGTVTPVPEYDLDAKENYVNRLSMTFGKGVTALDYIRLNGMFIRRDADADGVLDCVTETPDEPEIHDFTEVSATAARVCAGDPVSLEAQGSDETVLEKYVTEQTKFYITAKDYSGNGFHIDAATPATPPLEVTLTKNMVGKYYFDLPGDALKPGDYYLALCSRNGSGTADAPYTYPPLYNGIKITVHPREVTWTPQPGSSDWNAPDNWTVSGLVKADGTTPAVGSPWDCTNVILPAGAATYPRLKAGEENYCHFIHFAHGAEAQNTHYLNYRKAWVEMTLDANRYYMLAAPLKSMVTGDLFVPAALTGNHGDSGKVPYFTPLEASDEPYFQESRYTPRVYQRFWSTNVEGRKLEGNNLLPVAVQIQQTDWTAPFNTINCAYNPGMGFSAVLRGEQETADVTSFTFRFPKEHTAYHYYTAPDTPVGSEAVTRGQVGRFIYENGQGKATFPMTLWTGNVKGGTTFLAGNPFMCHLDVQAFLNKNPHITSLKIYDGSRHVSTALVDDGLLSSSETTHYIAPMQAFFVTTHAMALRVPLNFDEGMLINVPGNTLRTVNSRSLLTRLTAASTRGTMTRSGTSDCGEQLRIVATTQSGDEAATLLRLSASASDAYVAGEDVATLFDSDVTASVSLFSVADGQALDIQQLAGSTLREVPLGLRLKSRAAVTLTFACEGRAWSRWSVTDKLTGKHYPLDGRIVEIQVGITGTEAGRFCLVKNP